MTEYTVLPPVHLGSGPLGEARREALERWAADENCFWNGEPSNGRLVKKLADKRIDELVQKILETMLEMGAIEPKDLETVEGLVNADLSEDIPLIAEYVTGPEDYDGAQDYINAISGK